ncbi:CoA transferase [Nocardia sp. NPDC051750]|uniref:CoA transferase n=1 Tax=Nocardia sp. NPDC051750 TaxID=3364325 RepID=UPI00378D33A2
MTDTGHGQPRADTAPFGARPLSGLVVIEISSFVAAPLGGMTLAQLGAEVIRIDPLGGAGDRHRWPLAESGASLYWAGLNKGKQSLTVDLRSDDGRDLVRGLVAACAPRSAVLLTNSIGQDWLGYDALREVCDDLIHVHVRGRGDGSSAVDYTVNAEVGFPLITGPSGYADPINHVLPAWDIACGLYAATGICAAARHRELTGEGSALTVALADVALSMTGNLGLLADAQLNGHDRPRIGNHLYGGFARDFGSSDGHRFMVVALTNRHWRDLLLVTGTREPVEAIERAMGADFSREDDRFEYREILAGLFERWFARKSAGQIAAALEGTALLWAPYRTVTDLVAHLQTPEGHNPIVDVLDQPGVGPHLSPGLPLVLGGSPAPPLPAPQLGRDTRQILATHLGLTDPQIAELGRRGVLAASDIDNESAVHN